jgi:hypothetical protein
MVCGCHCPSLHLLIQREEYEILGRSPKRALGSSWCAASALCVSSKLRSVVAVQFLVVLGGAHRGTGLVSGVGRCILVDMHWLFDICRNGCGTFTCGENEGERKKERNKGGYYSFTRVLKFVPKAPRG